MGTGGGERVRPFDTGNNESWAENCCIIFVKSDFRTFGGFGASDKPPYKNDHHYTIANSHYAEPGHARKQFPLGYTAGVGKKALIVRTNKFHDGSAYHVWCICTENPPPCKRSMLGHVLVSPGCYTLWFAIIGIYNATPFTDC